MADEIERHRAGTPCWVVLVTPDTGRTGSFYAGLFGWSIPERGENFDTVDCRGRDVAGALQVPPDDADGATSRWLVYLATDDVGASLEKVQPAGGGVLLPAFDIGSLGRMAIAVDGTGAQFGLWEAGTHPGSQVTGQPGSLTWAELRTRSRASASGFYEAVFGWDFHSIQAGAEGYITCLLDKEPVAGMVELGAADGSSPSYWLPYFAVDNCDTTASRADALGGDVCEAPHDAAGHRLAVLRDPLGALFSVAGPEATAAD
ncbi:MAG TPA: VOC family protein [Acidimicrobiia bacterium]|nr:VOC family protein [Acidimicrobiia bacterium]